MVCLRDSMVFKGIRCVFSYCGVFDVFLIRFILGFGLLLG